jgi:peroxiredoxin
MAGGLPPHPPLWPKGRLPRLLGLFALAVGATVVSFAIVSRISGPKLLPGGAVAPAVSLDAATGEHLTVFGTGRPTVLEFFETTCAICQREVPAMCALRKAHPELDVYGIDAARENAATVNDFRRTQGNGCIGFPLLLDPNSQVLRSYSVTVVPTVYLIDAHGRVAYTGTGAGGVDGLSTAITTLAAHG